MSASSVATEGTPFSSSLITSRFVEGIGVHSMVNAGLASLDHNSVGFIAAISSNGLEFTESTLFWVGPAINVQLPVYQMFSHINNEVIATLKLVPVDQFFFPNSTFSQWSSGDAAIRRGEIIMSGGGADDLTEFKKCTWVYRIAIVCTQNIRQANIVLHTLPVSMSVINSLTDPYSPDLACLSFLLTTAPWSHPPDPDMKFYGPVPGFLDRRSAEAKSRGSFPPSEYIKKYISRVMLHCSANPVLTPDEIRALASEDISHPPSRLATKAVWPSIPPDIAPSDLSTTGSTPAQASQQTRGTPVIAVDQGALTIAAQKSLAMQSGRKLGDADDLLFQNDAPLSAGASNRRDALLNLFDNDLPDNLPSWDLLESMPLLEAVAFVNTKIDRAKDAEGECTDVDSFQKATTPVVYSTTQVDDRLTRLHSASFLRAPLSEPSVWASLMPKKIPQVTSLPEGIVGMDWGLSDLALKKMCDRTNPMALKYLLKSNAFVEKSAPISKRRAIQNSTGDHCELGWVNDFDFKEPLFPWEVSEALMAAIGANQQLFPLDYSIINLTRGITRFKLFYDARISTKFQVTICRSYVDTVFLANSRRARSQLPCLTLKQCEDIAVERLRHYKRDGIFPSATDVAASKGPLNEGDDPLSFGNFALTNAGKAQKQHLQQLQQQMAQIQQGGNYGRVVSSSQNRFNKQSGGAGRRGNPAASSTITSNKGLAMEICPSFTRGEACVRATSPTAKFCTTSAGVTLHHLCRRCGQSSHGANNHI